ncbi:MAG: VWA domain-containing protein [Spirochaetes bacterium]|nr:VWA domain-containing protein [Spirochaetota bacterium]
MFRAHDKERAITNTFIEFVHILKDAGVTISTVELIDMFEALRHINPYEKEIFRQALCTTLIKDYTDIPIFEKCFAEFFEKKSAQKGFDFEIFLHDAHNVSSLTQHPLFNEEYSQEIFDSIDSIIDAAFRNYPDKTPQDIIKLLLEDLESESGAIGQFIFNARSRSREGTIGNADIAEQEGEQGFIKDLIRERIQRRVFERSTGRIIQKREEYLLNRYIYRLTPQEVKEMRDLIKRFGQKLKNRISLRKKKVKHGGIDVKRTLRKNLQYGGTPFKILFKDKKIDRPQLVVLCDISSSVSQYSRFMLLLTYTLQSLFSKVRSFAFISNMVEITHLFREMDPERALNSIFEDTNFTYGWGSNYGHCFNQFIREYSDSLTSKTTVLILGDARNNNQDPGLESFIRIKERCRNLFWLNPDRRHLWSWSDSIAELYLPYCDEMKEVRNFLDLSEFIDKLFIR